MPTVITVAKRYNGWEIFQKKYIGHRFLYKKPVPQSYFFSKTAKSPLSLTLSPSYSLRLFQNPSPPLPKPSPVLPLLSSPLLSGAPSTLSSPLLSLRCSLLPLLCGALSPARLSLLHFWATWCLLLSLGIETARASSR